MKPGAQLLRWFRALLSKNHAVFLRLSLCIASSSCIRGITATAGVVPAYGWTGFLRHPPNQCSPLHGTRNVLQPPAAPTAFSSQHQASWWQRLLSSPISVHDSCFFGCAVCWFPSIPFGVIFPVCVAFHDPVTGKRAAPLALSGDGLGFLNLFLLLTATLFVQFTHLTSRAILDQMRCSSKPVSCLQQWPAAAG